MAFSKKQTLFNKIPSVGDVTNSKQHSPPSFFYDQAWANRKLRFAIGTLQGKFESSIWKRRVATALTIKEELFDAGYFWQAARIDNWIHRLQGQEKAKDEARIQGIPGPVKVSECLEGVYRPSGLTALRESKEASF